MAPRWALVGTLAGFAWCAQCGGLAADDDAGPDVEAGDAAEETLLPCSTGTFGTAAAIAELNTPDDERELRLTPDERTAIFGRRPSYDSGPEFGDQLFVATRSAVGDAFFTPIEQKYLEGFSPSLSANGLAAFWETLCGSYPVNALCMFERQGASDFFSWPNQWQQVVGGFDQKLGPIHGWDWGDGYVTADTAGYYVVAPTPADAGGGYRIVMSRRIPGADDAGDPNEFHTLTSVYVPPDPATFVDHPIVTADELTLYLATTAPNDTVPHIQTATRASIDEPFGPLTPLHELDSPGGEYPTWISVDQCRLYFTRNIGDRGDFYVASRTP
jgi:hypothetical protein